MTALEVASLLRLADSAFPSGAFSHSFGLESAIATERVRDEASLFAWLEAYLCDGWATMEGGALALALRDGYDPLGLDAIVSAATHAHEVRSANARITAAIFDTFAAMGAGGPRVGGTGIGGTRLLAYQSAVRERRATGVPALAFGLAYEHLGVAWRDAFVACASGTLAALAGVGTRALPLGQRATARVLWELRPAVLRAVALADALAAPEELHAQAFAQEYDALTHPLLDGRLFAS
jgi:urease accessory protein